jgi:hypothetical protein
MDKVRGTEKKPGDRERGLVAAEDTVMPSKQQGSPPPPGGGLSRPTGLLVLQASQLAASRFQALLRQFLADVYDPVITVDGTNLLRVEIPPAGAPRADEWFLRLELASRQNEWCVTTGTVVLLPGSVRQLRPDLPRSVSRSDPHGGRVPLALYSLHAEKTGITLLNQGQARETGRDDGVTSERGVIVVGNRAEAGQGYRGPVPPFGDAQIAETFLHEACCHAGTFSAGEAYEHPDPHVERLAGQVSRVFPSRVSAPINPMPRARPQF